MLLHGLLGDWRVWTPVLPFVEAHHDVLAPTLPGHFNGPPLADDGRVSVAAIADGVEATMDAAGLDRAHIAGNSLGGWLSLELAARGRALSVVALSPAGAWRSDDHLIRVSQMIRASVERASGSSPPLTWLMRIPAVRKQALRETMERGDRVPASALADMVEAATSCTFLEDFMVATGRDGPFAADLSKLTCPVRIAWSGSDRTIPFEDYGAPMVEAVPQAEVMTIPGVGHVPMYDDPEAVARAILEVSAADALRDEELSGRVAA